MKTNKTFRSLRDWTICAWGSLSENKGWEVELSFSFNSYLTLLRCDSWWTFEQDHAGPGFHIEVLGLSLEAQISDGRHWNRTTNTWCDYEHCDKFPLHSVDVDGKTFYFAGEFAKTPEGEPTAAKYERTDYKRYGLWVTRSGEIGTPEEE